MGVVRQRGEAKQQHRIYRHAEFGVVARPDVRWFARGSVRPVAVRFRTGRPVHDVLLVHDRQSIVLVDFVADGDEGERAASAYLLARGHYVAASLGCGADAQWRELPRSTAGEHSTAARPWGSGHRSV